jgi:hypothetical protein
VGEKLTASTPDERVRVADGVPLSDRPDATAWLSLRPTSLTPDRSPNPFDRTSQAISTVTTLPNRVVQ